MANDLPLGWYLDAKDRYRCYCRSFSTYDISEIQTHLLEDGYCKSGIKFISDTLLECICGKKFRSFTYANIHVLDGRGCMTKTLSFCHTCNLQLESVAAFKRHLDTKTHNRPDELKHLECKPCGIKCRGQKELETHLASAKHKQRSEEGTLPLTCDVCQITCKGQKQMKAHLETNKHKKKLVLINNEYVVQ
jgi:hypothetical protein